MCFCSPVSLGSKKSRELIVLRNAGFPRVSNVTDSCKGNELYGIMKHTIFAIPLSKALHNY